MDDFDTFWGRVRYYEGMGIPYHIALLMAGEDLDEEYSDYEDDDDEYYDAWGENDWNSG